MRALCTWPRFEIKYRARLPNSGKIAEQCLRLHTQCAFAARRKVLQNEPRAPTRPHLSISKLENKEEKQNSERKSGEAAGKEELKHEYSVGALSISKSMEFQYPGDKKIMREQKMKRERGGRGERRGGGAREDEEGEKFSQFAITFEQYFLGIYIEIGLPHLRSDEADRVA